MQSGPSRTARRVAEHRAAHQLLDSPRVFDDPLAVQMAGADEGSFRNGAMGYANSPRDQAMRAFLVARSRFAEDELGRALESRVSQYVVLGAGLDTFAYRNGYRGLRVFEVDHPETQRWKRERLKAAGVALPESLTFAPVNFEEERLADRLCAAGFDTGRPAFVSWLGVTQYLTGEAFRATATHIAGLPKGSGVVFDYGLEQSCLGPLERLALAELSERVARAGEPFLLSFRPEELAGTLAGFGFARTEDLGREELNARYFKNRGDAFRVRGGLGRLMSAWV